MMMLKLNIVAAGVPRKKSQKIHARDVVEHRILAL